MSVVAGGVPPFRAVLGVLVVTCLLQGRAQGITRVPAWWVEGGGVKSTQDILSVIGYPYEQHQAVTDDGYILTIDRIPNPGKPPVYLMTPFLTAAPVYVSQGLKSFGVQLHDAGFDVWIGNVRGTAYSTRHVKLAKFDPVYWNFSFHEHGVYDHPACIAKMLSVSGFGQGYVVGYSMGSTSYVVMASERPAFSARTVRAAFLMAPATFLFYSQNSLVQVFRKVYHTAEPFSNRNAFWVFPHALARKAQQQYCPQRRLKCSKSILRFNDATITTDLFTDNIYFDETFPGGGSFRTFWHFAQQAFEPAVFRPYDYSPEENMARYGSVKPPNYPLERINTNISFYRGASDTFTHPADFAFLQQRVPTIVKDYVLPDPVYSHSDFVYSNKTVLASRIVVKDMQDHYRAAPFK